MVPRIPFRQRPDCRLYLFHAVHTEDREAERLQLLTPFPLQGAHLFSRCFQFHECRFPAKKEYQTVRYPIPALRCEFKCLSSRFPDGINKCFFNC